MAQVSGAEPRRRGSRRRRRSCDAGSGRKQGGLLRRAPPHAPGQSKPYIQARVRRDGKLVHLGYFATAEEAALCVARSPEGRAAAVRAAAAESGEPGHPPCVVPSGASLACPLKEEDSTVPPMPPGAFVKDEGVVPPMPPDAFVKVEVVVKRVKEEEGSTDGRPKRQRAN